MLLLPSILTKTIHSQFRNDKVQLDEDIPYSYEIFHIVFAMGAMYFAMLFISWELNHPTRK
jgi:serine incorporator 1/3